MLVTVNESECKLRLKLLSFYKSLKILSETPGFIVKASPFALYVSEMMNQHSFTTLLIS